MVNSKLISDCALEQLDIAAMASPLPITAIRLRERMDEMDWDQDGLAEAIGASQGAISQILTGLTRNSRLLPKIAHALSINLDWLVGTSDEKIDMFDANGADLSEDDLAAIRAGKGRKKLVKPDQLKPRVPAPSREAMAEALGLVPVRELDLSLGMGATYLEAPVTETIRHFDKGWLRAYSKAAPKDLLFAQGLGDSMQPTINDSDLLLIDTTQRSINMTDRIWAVAYANCGAVKRLRPRADGGIEMISDNTLVPNETAYDGELHVLGRVVAIVRKM